VSPRAHTPVRVRALDRLLFTTDAVGGVWQYTLELARGLAAEGTAIDVAVLGPPPSAAQEAQAAAIPGVTLHRHPGRLEWMDQSPQCWAEVDEAGGWLVGLAEERGAQLVHLGGYSHAAAGFRVPALVVGHSCVLSWWRAVKGEEAPESWDTYRRRVTAGIAAASAVVAPTEAMAAALRQHYGADEVVVVHNGHDQVGLAGRGKVPCVLSAGRLWDEAKNTGMLARVARRLPWSVRLAGPCAPGDAAAQPFAPALCLGPLGPAAIAAQYARAAIYAAPAYYEPFGLAVLEAASAGCALVLGDIPSLRELWSGAALFVNPRDEGQVAGALLSLIQQPARRTELAVAAMGRARRYRRQHMLDGYRQLYRRLLARTLDRTHQGKAQGNQGANDGQDLTPEESLPCAS
jgi:glycogen(starch) synthase